MSPLTRAIFGVFAFLPAIGVLSIAVYLTSQISDGSLGDPDRWFRDGHLAAPLLYAGAAILVVTFVQSAVGVFVAMHTGTRKDLTSGEKAAWSLACVFVGSVALPLFFFMKSQAGPPLPELRRYQ